MKRIQHHHQLFFSQKNFLRRWKIRKLRFCFKLLKMVLFKSLRFYNCLFSLFFREPKSELQPLKLNWRCEAFETSCWLQTKLMKAQMKITQINCDGFHRVNQKRPFKKLRTFLLIFANLRVFDKLSNIKNFDQLVPQPLVTFWSS